MCSELICRVHAAEIKRKNPPRQATQKFIERKQNENFDEWFRAHASTIL